MSFSTLSSRVMALLATIAIGYLLMAGWFRLFPPVEANPDTLRAAPTPAPDILLEQQTAGVDLPLEMRRRMLGQVDPRARPAQAADARTNDTNYAYIIGDRLDGQITEMKQRLRTTGGSRQEDRLTEKSLDAMARDGRMAW